MTSDIVFNQWLINLESHMDADLSDFMGILYKWFESDGFTIEETAYKIKTEKSPICSVIRSAIGM